MQSILSIKEKLEEQAKAEYGLEAAKLREEEQKLEQLIARKEAYQESLKEAVQDTLDVRQIKELEDCVEHAKYTINVQRFVIRQQQERVDLAREKLDNAMKERKTYEKLREKAFEQFKIEIEAQERKEIDELVSFRFRDAQKRED